MNFPIKYANCWEDPKMLLATYPEKSEARVFSIASGGDNSFALLIKSPALVLFTDMNPAQIYLCELKKAAIKLLEYKECLGFLGFHPSEARLHTFRKLISELSPEALIFWKNNPEAINNGVIHFGKFENYFKLFREKVLPWIHSKNRLKALLDQKTQEKQEEFYHEVWNSWRWRLLFKLFFSRPVMAKFGRSKAYLNQVQIPVGPFIFAQAEKELSHKNAQENPFLRAIFTGDFAVRIPFYLQEQHFTHVKAGIDKIRFFHGSAQEAILQHEPFDFYNFSNIFEYFDTETFEQFRSLLMEKHQPNCRIAYWNLMVDRVFSEKDGRFKILPIDLHDHGFFYKRFVGEEMR